MEVALCFSLTCTSSSVFLTFYTDPCVNQTVQNKEYKQGIIGRCPRLDLGHFAFSWRPCLSSTDHSAHSLGGCWHAPTPLLLSSKEFKRVLVFIILEIKFQGDVIDYINTDTFAKEVRESSL